MYYEITDHFIVSAGPRRTWDFFATADNLPRITPPWLSLRIETPAPIAIGPDTLLDYTIRWAGLPVRWRTKIIDWQPPRQFIDLQVRGPYLLWHHQHTFTETSDGVACRDRVIYRLPVPLLGRLVHAAVVKKQLLNVFRFRRELIRRELGWVRSLQSDVQVRKL